jgi:hypothetical protein
MQRLGFAPFKKKKKHDAITFFAAQVAQRTPPGTDGFSVCEALAATNGGNPKAPILPSFHGAKTSCVQIKSPQTVQSVDGTWQQDMACFSSALLCM